MQTAEAAPMIARPSEESIEPRKARPILYWAALGGAFSLLFAYLMVAWVTGDHFKTIPSGPTEVPTYMKVGVRANEVFGTLLMLYLLYRFIYKPWRRFGSLSFEGSLLIATFSAYGVDPIYNYFNWGFTYNTYAVNWGSWAADIPGWASFNATQWAEAPLMFGTWYGSVMFLGALLGAHFMRYVKRRRPQTGTVGLVVQAYLVLALADFVMEIPYMRLGMYFYTQTWEPATLFHGKFYRFPIYESFTWAAVWTTCACLYYFRNDKGETLVEGGVERLTVSTKTKVGLRTLALVGVINIAILLSFSLPNNFFAGHSSGWIDDHLKRSYVTNGICGAGTNFACGGGSVPTPVGHNASMGGDKVIHLDPNGNLVVPPGTKLPKEVPFDD